MFKNFPVTGKRRHSHSRGKPVTMYQLLLTYLIRSHKPINRTSNRKGQGEAAS